MQTLVGQANQPGGQPSDSPRSIKIAVRVNRMKNVSISTDRVLKTKRLNLRCPKLNDAAEIFTAVKSPQFPEQLPLKEMDAVSEIEEWLRRLQENWTTGQGFSWIVEDRDSGDTLGQVTLSKVKGDHVWAMAFWIHPEYWGKGYATESAECLLAFGFEEIGAENIWAGAGEWNEGSTRVLEKIGMEYIGDNPVGYYSKGEPITTREYEISRESWQRRTSK